LTSLTAPPPLNSPERIDVPDSAAAAGPSEILLKRQSGPQHGLEPPAVLFVGEKGVPEGAVLLQKI
jgi:hypothetical protein